MSTNAPLVFNRLNGYGPVPTICLPGFVPRSKEAFHKQIGLLRAFGDVWLVDYPDDAFNLDEALTQLSEVTCRMAKGGNPPVIVSVSYGSALVMQLLQKKPELSIGGCIFISPMVGLRDIYRDDNDATFFGKLADAIINGREYTEDRIGRARKVFRRLLRAGHWWDSGITQPIIDEIDRALVLIKDKAVSDRLKAIGEIGDLGGKTTITTAPTLILWAEEEQDVIRQQSKNYKLLCEQPGKLFPVGKSVILRSGNPKNRLKHASLLAHSACYNKHIKEFYMNRILGGCASYGLPWKVDTLRLMPPRVNTI